MYIYKVTNNITGKSYIGKTEKSVTKRINKHKLDAMNNIYPNNLFHRAIRKYGIESFKCDILKEYDSKILLDAMETAMIVFHKTHMYEGGYNMTWGGDGGDTFTGNPNNEERRKKISIANKGKKRTEEQNKRQSLNRTGEKHAKFSLEARKHLSTIRMGRKFSDESREKISNAHRGKILTEEIKDRISNSKKKYTNEIVNEMRKLREVEKLSFREIGRKLNIPFPSVVFCLKNRNLNELQNYT